MSLRSWITRRLVAFLTAPIGRYELAGPNDFERLEHEIHKGDVLLVEGDQRVSAVIKFLTQSSWSHAALYVGDELTRRDREAWDFNTEHSADDPEHMLVEALFDGVVASPLSKYAKFNVRVVRPHRLRSADLTRVLDDAIRAIGWRYDLRNIIDLALHLLAVSLMPRRYRKRSLRFGSGAATAVICTSLLGRIYHSVGFPVLPEVTQVGEITGVQTPKPRLLTRLLRRTPPAHSGLFRDRHPSLLTPRDFDLSPYFEVVKFNVIERRDFDYRRIEWADEEGHEDEVA